MDLLPTLADIARPGLSNELARPVDGRSLVPLLEGGAESDDATAVGEYLAESALGPMVMIRRGPWKFIHTQSDPDQLFDVDKDPLERVNLAGAPEHEALVEELRAEVSARWDLEAIENDVRASQRARLTVYSALQHGATHPWDFQPSRAASKQYTRNTMDVAERDQQSRFPAPPS